MPNKEPGTIATETLTVNNQPVVMRIFQPEKGPPTGVVVIAPAMGVGQRYYSALAHWLTRRQLLVATFDYRGIGLSRDLPLKRLDVDILNWAEQDSALVLERVCELAPALPVTWVGHSLGGQIVPMMANHTKIDQVVTVACGSGYWRENAPQLKRVSWWLWFFVAPVALKIWGYFPGRRLRKIGDVPAGVMSQWRRWCLNPEYAVGAEGDTMRARFAAMSLPVSALAFTDDEYMSRRNVESLHGLFAGARVDIALLSPGEVGVKRIGHFDFFRTGAEDLLWRRYLLPRLATTAVC